LRTSSSVAVSNSSGILWPKALWSRVPLYQTPDDRVLKQAERKIGQLTMENEVLRAAAEQRGLQIPSAKRPR
jgi:hypothetical protein